MSDNDDLLPAGCYFIQFTPTRPVPEVKHFDGTLRVTRSDDKTRASADLYAHPTAPAAGAFPEHCENPPRETKVPIFPRGQYRFYLEVRGIDVGFSAKDHVCFRFEVHEFNRETKRLEARGSRTAMVAREPNREPRRLRGKVLNEENGEVVGEMTLAWVCASLRRAIVEIDAEPGLAKPEGSGPLEGRPKEQNWPDIFETVRWEVCAIPSKRKIREIEDHPPGRPWTDAELHQAMQQGRDAGEESLDQEWRYHLLCVGEFANPQYQRGVMYDVGGSDLNDRPREGAAVAAKWSVPAGWLNGKMEFQKASALYFRTAVHEIGHAMGLGHSEDAAHLMNTTDAIHEAAKKAVEAAQAASAQAQARATAAQTEARIAAKRLQGLRGDRLAEAKKLAAALAKQAKTEAEKAREASEAVVTAIRFPKNVKWEFSKKDQERLQHAPDVMVRPGAFIDEELQAFADEAPTPASGLRLELTPLMPAVPFGAPVRVRLRLTNTGDKSQFVPASLHLKSDFVSGEVIDPSGGDARPFYPVMRSLDKRALAMFKPGDKPRYHSLTLLRGHRGALFRSEGVHTIRVRVTWRQDGKPVFVEGETQVRVEPPVDMLHRMAALQLLNEPEALLSLALGGEHLKEGWAAIEACLRIPTLRPHLAVAEIKRRIEERAVRTACEWLEEDVVLSVSEINRVAKLAIGLIKSRLAQDRAVRETCEQLEKEDVLTLLGIDRLTKLLQPHVESLVAEEAQLTKALAKLVESRGRLLTHEQLEES